MSKRKRRRKKKERKPENSPTYWNKGKLYEGKADASNRKTPDSACKNAKKNANF
jgi:hypothetical protein